MRGFWLLVAVSLSVGCRPSGGVDRRAEVREKRSDPLRSVAPDFSLETLDGGSLRLSGLRGRVVLIDFWATYCGPCLGSLPLLDALGEKYAPKGFTVLSVNIDGPESLGKVRSEVMRLGLHMPVLFDSETRVLSEYNPKTAIPYSVLLDRKGAVLLRKEGFLPGDMQALELAVERALGSEP